MFDRIVRMELLSTTEPVAEMAAEVLLEELRDALIAAQATISAAQARFAQALAVFRSREGHAIGSGFPTFATWATVDLGLSRHQTATLADAGDDALLCPQVRAAWEAGELSTTKAAAALSVATPETEGAWCDMALESSSNQLVRIVRTYRRTTPKANDDTENSNDDQSNDPSDQPADETGVWWRTRDDGLAELTAILPAADAAVVRAALEAQAELAWRARRKQAKAAADTADGTGKTGANESRTNGAGPDKACTDQTDTGEAPTGEAADEIRDDANRDDRPRCRCMADALVALAATALEVGDIPIVRGRHIEVVLHVDEAFLTGRTKSGRCHLDEGPTISIADAHRLACDARIVAMVHGADGSVVDLGRSQRIVSDKQRRLLTERDHGCRFPGCANTRYVDAHHVIYWENGGPTDMTNLVLLCSHHHHELHKGVFDIKADGQGGFTFYDRWRRPISPPREPARQRCRPSEATTRARSGGDPRLSINDAVTALACQTPTAA